MAVKQEGKLKPDYKKIAKWLKSQESHTVHAPVRNNYKHRKVISPYLDYQWDADTAYMLPYKKQNKGFAYFLLVIDIMSRYVWTRAMKTTQGIETAKVLEDIFITSNRQCDNFRSDAGPEFTNKRVRDLLQKRGINYFVTNNTVKAAVAERAIKTIKRLLHLYMTAKQTHEWVDVLPKLTHSYNHSYHRSIKMIPSAVTKADENGLWTLQYDNIGDTGVNKFKFDVGNLVRITARRHAFTREYDERWTRELFYVVKRESKGRVNVYKLKDYQNESIIGSFYEEELQKVSLPPHPLFLIEKVLKRRGNQVYVRWLGWPAKYNSWLSRASLENI